MNFKTPSQTDFLFARPSFASGMARALDLFGHFDDYNSSASELEADLQAIACDWLVVGNDLRAAMRNAEGE